MRVRVQGSLILISCLSLSALAIHSVSAQSPLRQDTARQRSTSKAPPAKPGTAATKPPAAKVAKPAPPPSYEMPKTNDVAKLGTHLSRLLDYRPTTQEQAKTHEQKGPAVMNAVARRIITLEKDKNSTIYRFASKYLLAMKLVDLDKATGQDKVAIYKEIQTSLMRPDMDADDIDIAVAFADGLQTVGDYRLAGQAYAGFAKTLSRSKEPLVVEFSKSMEATSRRLQLPGKPIKLVGTPVTGGRFDWSAYRGKVVLIDFWATWCRPCLAELPNVEKLLAKYGSEGFEVVSISMDEDRSKLDAFLAKKPLPWVVLHNEGGKNPSAQYYGVNAVPTAILVDRAGNVVSLAARGKKLEQLLGGLMSKTAARK